MTAIKDFFSELWLIVTSMEAQDYVDVILVSILLYYAFTFIRNRRAGKLTLGVFLLLALQLIASAFDLVTINFILGNFFEVGVLALIVLFQPELRSALEKMGSEPLRSLKIIGEKNGDQKTALMIESICESCCQMAKDKTGALIVIERKTKLGEHINSGTVINADPSTPILLNLFYKNSPLHDGAVVIRENRVYAAGCFLPLSTSEDFKELGTRHHAAVGVSEVSDAVVVVVSEQTGAISVANEGRLLRNFDYVSLKIYLSKLLIQSGSDSHADGKKKKNKKKKASKKTDEIGAKEEEL